MSCSRRHCARGVGAKLLSCRCGATFCSDACFISEWHAGHKQVCQFAHQIAAEAGASQRRGQAALCKAALTPLQETPRRPASSSSSATANLDFTQRTAAESDARSAKSPRSARTPVRSGSSSRCVAASFTASPRSTGYASSRPSLTPSTATSVSQARSLIDPQAVAAWTPTSYSLEDFEGPLHPIGSGAFGVVKRVVHRRTGEAFAMKVIPKDKIEEHEMIPYLLREVKTQLKIKHPNILRLYQYFEDSAEVHLLLELATEGSLFKRMQRGGRLPEPEAAPIFAGVSGALDHLHQKHGIVHRDVKPENILLCNGGVAKLADFGWCAEFSERDARKTFCGTLDYLSPEMVRGGSHDHAVDVWAMGVLLYEMLWGKTPFDGRSISKSVARISSVDLRMPEAIPALARDLIERLLVLEPRDRLPLSEAVRHSWVTSHTRASLAPTPRAADQPPAPPLAAGHCEARSQAPMAVAPEGEAAGGDVRRVGASGSGARPTATAPCVSSQEMPQGMPPRPRPTVFPAAPVFPSERLHTLRLDGVDEEVSVNGDDPSSSSPRRERGGGRRDSLVGFSPVRTLAASLPAPAPKMRSQRSRPGSGGVPSASVAAAVADAAGKTWQETGMFQAVNQWVQKEKERAALSGTSTPSSTPCQGAGIRTDVLPRALDFTPFTRGADASRGAEQRDISPVSQVGASPRTRAAARLGAPEVSSRTEQGAYLQKLGAKVPIAGSVLPRGSEPARLTDLKDLSSKMADVRALLECDLDSMSRTLEGQFRSRTH